MGKSAAVAVAVGLMAAASVIGCAMARRVVWSDAAALCDRDPAECQRRCDMNQSHATECDVLTVKWVQDHDLGDEDAATLTSRAERLQPRCADGVQEACSAQTKLEMAASGAKRHEAKAKGVASEQADMKERIAKVKADLQSLDADVSKTRRHLPAALMYRLSDSKKAMGLAYWGAEETAAKVEAAESVARDIRSWIADQQASQAKLKAEDDAARAASAEEQARRTEVSDGLRSCAADPDACKKECGATPTSTKCFGVAVLYFSGTTVPKDRRKSRELAKATCDAQGWPECTILATFETMEADEKRKQKAEQDLPRLFAECAANHRRVLQLKAARDLDGLRALEPAWSANIDEVREAIELVTNNEGPRYTELLVRFKACAEAR